ncbi:MAG: DUF5655 domain-containing protein [Bacteroidales bacterium]|jgi:predicted transport protein
MKKTKTKKAVSTKKSNVSAKKQNEKKSQKQTIKAEPKQTPKARTENKKKVEYPDWTKPEHLNEKDCKDLRRFYELYQEQKFDVALNFASSLDTAVRDEIPVGIWAEIGGELTPSGEEELQKSKKKEEVKPEQKEIRKELNHFQSPYVLKDDKLLATTEEFFIGDEHTNEAKFYKESDLEEFITKHHKTLFGENTVVIDNTKSKNEFFPKMFLFDFSDKEKPRMYIIEIILSENNLGLLYARITHFLAYLRSKNYQNDFIVELCNVINANDETKNELKSYLYEEQEISELLSDMLDNKPAILILKDNENVVLDLMQAVYIETWGKMVRQILVKKYYCNNNTIFNVNPLFADIWKNDKQKKEEAVKLTENDHLCELPDRIRKIYNDIKSALLETDSTLEFNPKKHYISIRKNKNLAFLHLRRKNVDIVVMNEESDTRERVKLHRIKSLPESVKRFWNGECCTIVVENSDNLQEVIELLKMIVGKSNKFID